MKKFLATAFFILGMNIMIAQNSDQKENPSLDPSQVPASALGKFTEENPGIAATWRSDAQNYRVNYIDPNTKLGRIIIYDKDGKVVRRENEVDRMTYPEPINGYYKKNHPGETYQVWSSEEKESGRPLYYSSRNNETIWFDQEGNIIPVKKAEKAVAKPRRKK